MKNKKIDTALLGAAAEGMLSTSPPDALVALPGFTGHLDGEFGGGDATATLHLTLNDDFSINGGVREELVGPLHFRPQWDKIVALPAQDPKNARSAGALSNRVTFP